MLSITGASAIAAEPAWWTQQKIDCGLPSSLAYNTWVAQGSPCPGKNGAAGGGSVPSLQNQLVLDAAGLLGTALGEMLRGDPQKAARLEAEARERSLAQQKAAQEAAAEAERKKQETFLRLRGELKLDNFDGDGGGLHLKGVDVDTGGGLSLKLGDSEAPPALKLGDDDLKPKGTQASANSGAPESPAPNTDPMVVDLRNLKQSAFLVRSFETAAPEDAPVLLDEALKAANGEGSFIGSVPAGITMPAIDSQGLIAFQKANRDYRKEHDFRMKCDEAFRQAQQRRQLADAMAKEARADLERAKTSLADATTLQQKQKLLADIFAATKAEDVALAKARKDLEAARNQDYQAKEEAVRVLRATTSGKDPATFHPPIASLPSLDEKTWIQTQMAMIAARTELDRDNLALRKQLKDMAVPTPVGYERYHEGVILGYRTHANDATAMMSVTSPFSGRTPADMEAAAQAAQADGRERTGGAMVVSFGTTQTGTASQEAVEATRVIGDHQTIGRVSLSTPEGKAAVAALSGKEFDRLIAHSNGASITEALIQDDLIKVNELNVVGGDRSLLNGHALQKLLDTGKVKRVVVWINLNDPVVWGTSVDQIKPEARTLNALEHFARKMTGDLAGGDARVEYRLMVGAGKNFTFDPHYLETYYAGINKRLTAP